MSEKTERAATLSNERIIELARPHLLKINGGYLCDVHPDTVVAMVRAALADVDAAYHSVRDELRDTVAALTDTQRQLDDARAVPAEADKKAKAVGVAHAIAQMHTSTGYRCQECCAKAGEPHVAGCSQIAASAIEQWSTGMPIPECPICHDTGTTFGKKCECCK